MDSEKSYNISKALDWYVQNQNLYKSLSKKVESILSELIQLEDLQIHGIYSREKTLESFSRKIQKKGYRNPHLDVTDLAGVRIVTYVESQIEPIKKVIEGNFEIDISNSLDKGDELGVDKVGYKSIHYIAKLKNERLKLPEYKRFEEIKFEIQLRTILQHAWAEIEHDRNYKFTGKLPSDVQRRFRLLAGMLESADREFNSISNEIDKISREVRVETQKGNLNIAINSTSVKQYFATKFEKLFEAGAINGFASNEDELEALKQIDDFGLKTLKDIDDIIPSDFIANQIKIGNASDSNLYGLIIDVLVIADYKKYFSEVYKKEYFEAFDRPTIELYKIYNVPIEKLIDEYKLDII